MTHMHTHMEYYEFTSTFILCPVSDVRFHLYNASFLQVSGLDVRDGQVAVGDHSGNVALLNFEGEVIWSKQGEGTHSFLVSNCVHVQHLLKEGT